LSVCPETSTCSIFFSTCPRGGYNRGRGVTAPFGTKADRLAHSCRQKGSNWGISLKMEIKVASVTCFF
jgi:hypothetical protein